MIKNNELSVLDKVIHAFEMIYHWFNEFIDDLFYERTTKLDTDFGNRGEIISRKYNKEGLVVDGLHSLPRKTCYENAILLGTTGTGKGVNVCIPTALHLDDASVVIHDPSGVTYDSTAAHFLDKGYKVQVIDFDKSAISSGYNPLVNVKSSTEIATISHVLVNASMGSTTSDPFWKLASESLLNLLISLCLELPEHLRHLPNVLHLLEYLSHSPKEFDKFVARFCKSEKTFSAYKSFISQSDKLNSSIIANTKACLSLFEMDDLAMTMSYNGIDFSQLRNTKTVIYIRNNIAKQKMYGPATSIFVNQLFEFVFSSIPKKEELAIFMLLDEMSSIYISDFSNYLSNVRKHFCSVLHAWQSPSQLKNLYKEQADAILANSRSQIIIPAGMDYPSAKQISERMGMFEWEDEKGRKSKRQLMHPQELIESDPQKGFLFVGHRKPIRLTMTPFYEQRKLLKLSQKQKPILPNYSNPKGIPLFDFNQL